MFKTISFSSDSVQSPSLVQPVQKTSSSVTLEWSYNEADHAHPAFITGYLVKVQDGLLGRAASGCRGNLPVLVTLSMV